MRKKLFSVLMTALFAVGFCAASVSAQTAKAVLSEEILSQLVSYLPESEDNPLNLHWVDRNGNEVQRAAQQSTSVARKARLAAVLPESYDLRTLQNASGRTPVTSPKHQGSTDYCWAFAAAGAAESNVLLQNLEREDWFTEGELAFSPLHLGKTAMFEKKGIAGLEGDYLLSSYDGTLMGNDFVAAAALSADVGIQLEKETPFSQLAYGVEDAQHAVSYYHLKDYSCMIMDRDNPTSEENTQKRETVKRWLMSNGACTVIYKGTAAYNGTYKEESVSSCYQCATTASSHASVIVGWDDAFDCFNPSGAQPPAAGAWLIKDSYGEGRGTGGYFWLSYFDTSIASIGSICMDSAESYDNNYQYTGVMPFGGFPGVKAANVFTAEKEEKLSAVSVLTGSENVSYTVTIYRLTEEDLPESGTLCATVSGTFAYGGYHTIPLEDEISLSAGERFSVVLELEGEDAYILIEQCGSSYYSGYTVGVGCSEGQSYLNYDFFGEGEVWLDVVDIVDDENQQVFGNIPIHALTCDVVPQTDKTTLDAALEQAESDYGTWSEDQPLGAVQTLWSQFSYDLQQAAEISASDSVKQFEIKNAANNLRAAMSLLGKTTVTAMAYENQQVRIDAPRELGSVVLIAARYAGNKLAGVKPLPVTVGKGKKVIDIPTDVAAQTGETFRVMLWSSLEGLVPLAASIG